MYSTNAFLLEENTVPSYCVSIIYIAFESDVL